MLDKKMKKKKKAKQTNLRKKLKNVSMNGLSFSSGTLIHFMQEKSKITEITLGYLQNIT